MGRIITIGMIVSGVLGDVLGGTDKDTDKDATFSFQPSHPARKNLC